MKVIDNVKPHPFDGFFSIAIAICISKQPVANSVFATGCLLMQFLLQIESEFAIRADSLFVPKHIIQALLTLLL